MDFESELRSTLNSKSKEQIQAADLWDREQQRRIESRRNNATEVALKAQAVSREKIEPYLGAVNKALADGKGKLSVPHVSRNSKLVLQTTLAWGETGDEWRKEGYKVIFDINLLTREISWQQNIRNVAGKKMSASLNYEAPDFDRKMKDLVRTIAGSPANYFYHDTYIHKQE